MSKNVKILLIVATSLLLFGGILFGCAIIIAKGDFTSFSTDKLESREYILNEKFNSISINTDTADIIFAKSADENCKVMCYEHKKAKHSVNVKNDALEITLNDEKSWYDNIGISTDTSKIMIYLSGTEYNKLNILTSTSDIKIPKEFVLQSINIELSTGDIKCSAPVKNDIKITASTGDVYLDNTSPSLIDISTSTGDIIATDISCGGDIKVGVSTGRINFTNVTCQNLSSIGDTGDIQLKNVIALKKIDIERSTGDVTLDGCDGGEILIETSTGDVSGTLLTDKVFTVTTNTGDKEVPSTAAGGRCEITTDTGDIRISIKK